MVFLRKVKTASGATAVQIARRENRRDVVVEHLGSAHTDAELAALMQVGRRKIEAGQGVLDLNLGARQNPTAAVVQAQASRLLVDVVAAAWRTLGLDVIADETFFQLVLARVVEPTSISDAVRVLSELSVSDGLCKWVARLGVLPGWSIHVRHDRWKARFAGFAGSEDPQAAGDGGVLGWADGPGRG